MGMQVGKSGGVKNDINVTPLIDVVLVLLIIFLVTMPIMMRTITLQVPRKSTELDKLDDIKSITITVKADLTVEIDNTERVVTAPRAATPRKLVGSPCPPARLPFSASTRFRELARIDTENLTPVQAVRQLPGSAWSAGIELPQHVGQDPVHELRVQTSGVRTRNAAISMPPGP